MKSTNKSGCITALEPVRIQGGPNK